jgi:hypothetical protein
VPNIVRSIFDTGTIVLCSLLNIFFITEFLVIHKDSRDKWAPVTTAWRVFGLWMEERPLIWRVAANIFNKQSGEVDKGWSSSLGGGLGEVLTTPQRKNV